MTTPVMLTSTPPLTTPRHGLLSVATIVDEPDQRWLSGIEYVGNAAVDAEVLPIDCDDPATGTIGDGPASIIDGAPFLVRSAWECKRPGLTDAEIEQFTRAKLTASEGPAVERQAWAQAVDATTDTPTGTSPMSIMAGIGALEAWLYANYGGTGVIHVPRAAVAHLVKHNQIDVVSGRLETALGTSVAAGAYPGSGPSGDPADPGTMWVAATGAVQVRRTAPRIRTTFDHRTNTQLGVGDRSYLLSWEHVAAAALLTLEES